MNTKEIIKKAFEMHTIIPAFNITYLPMVESVIQAIKDEDCFALVEVAMVDWTKLGAQSMEAVAGAYQKYADERYMRLHLDHIPVIDEDNNKVDYLKELRKGISLGYQSLMIDGSRLSLDENIRCTREGASLAHETDLAIEAELGAVLGHEEGPLPPYEEIFESGRGFTVPEEAARFVRESGCDMLSVAVGNVHGAISEAYRNQKKPDARINIEHVKKLRDACGIPLVLHGGSGIGKQYILEAMKNGIAKINVGTEIRQPYCAVLESEGMEAALDTVYKKVRYLLSEFFEISGNRKDYGL